MEREGELSFKAGKCLIKTSKSLPLCQQEKKKNERERRPGGMTLLMIQLPLGESQVAVIKHYIYYQLLDDKFVLISPKEKVS